MKMLQSSIALACLLAGANAFGSMPAEPAPSMEPEPPQDPLASGECVDLDGFTMDILGSNCADLADYCTGEYEALVGPLCPVTCGKCADWCTDQDSMMALWADQNAGWPVTCAEADETHAEDGIYMTACGGSSNKCSGGRRSLSPAAMHPFLTSGTFKIGRRSLSAAAIKALITSGGFKIKK